MRNILKGYHEIIAISVTLSAGTGGTATFTPATGTSYSLSSLPVGVMIAKASDSLYNIFDSNGTVLGSITVTVSSGYRKKYVSVSRGGVLIEITTTPTILQDGDNIIAAFELNAITIGLYSDVNIHWEYKGSTISSFNVPYDEDGIQVNIERDYSGNYLMYLYSLDSGDRETLECICPSSCVINSVLLDGQATTMLLPPYSGSPYTTTVSYDKLDGVYLETNQYGAWYDGPDNVIDFVPVASGGSSIQLTLNELTDEGPAIFDVSGATQSFGNRLKYVPYNKCAIVSLKYDGGNMMVEDERFTIQKGDYFVGVADIASYEWESYSGGSTLANNLMNNQGYCLSENQPMPTRGINYMIQSDRDNSKYFLIAFKQGGSYYMVGLVDSSGYVLQYYCFSYGSGPLKIASFQFYQQILNNAYYSGSVSDFKGGIRDHTPIYSTAQIGYALDDYFF